MSAHLILAHEPRVADDISGEYRGKPARKVLVGGQRSLGCLEKKRSESNDLLPNDGTKPTVRRSTV
jgi:hypothetical protein